MVYLNIISAYKLENADKPNPNCDLLTIAQLQVAAMAQENLAAKKMDDNTEVDEEGNDKAQP